MSGELAAPAGSERPSAAAMRHVNDWLYSGKGRETAGQPWAEDYLRDAARMIDSFASAEIRATWRAARDANGQNEAFRIIERMVDRLGYGRTENNPSLVPLNDGTQRPGSPDGSLATETRKPGSLR